MQLFEREKPLRTLEEALESVRGGEGRLALISGEAGVGKTTLVERFNSRLSEPVYWGACDALFTPRPLGPFIDIAFQMRSGLLDLIQSGPDWYHVATAFLAELSASETPVIVVVEDIHWADEATFDLLMFLARRIQHSRALLILTFRDDELHSRHSLWRDGIHKEGFPPLQEVMRSFVDNGGQIWACGACTKPRGITEADLIPGARIVTAANVVEQLLAGAASMSF